MPGHTTITRTLVIVSHVVHFDAGTRLLAYGPYAREIDIWADLFDQVIIAGPVSSRTPDGDAVPFTRPNIAIHAVPETGGRTVGAKLAQLAMLPSIIWSLVAAMRRADAIHVRCPGNIGLLGVLLAPLFSRYLVAKYANQWNGYAGEPWTVRLQRRLLRSRWWKGPVTVYGEWPDSPPHVVPFFTSMMTASQVEHARHVAARKTFDAPLRVLFVGRLAASKRVDALIEALRLLVQQGRPIEAVIVGGGPDEAKLREQVRDAVLDSQVSFAGALDYESALRWYEWGQCLVLPSRHSEGWPKVVAEAMCYGLVCVAVAHGQVPAMVRGRGILLHSGDAAEIAGALDEVLRDPERFRTVAAAAAQWSSGYSLEGLRTALDGLLRRTWQHRPLEGRAS
jgi:glycosyltransferase involved in cell wall biosynthesis